MNPNATSLLVALCLFGGGFPASAQEVGSHAEPEDDIDTTPPATTGTLTATASGNAVTLTWYSTGDDGMVGTPSHYDIRCSEEQMDESNWAAAMPIELYPPVAPATTFRSVTVMGMKPDTTYWFGLKTVDNVQLESGISNRPSVTTGDDTTPPDTVTGPAVTKGGVTMTTLDLIWTVPSNPWGSGITEYDLRWCPGANGDVTTLWDDPGTISAADEPEPPKGDGQQEAMTLTGLAPGTSYSIAIRACDAAGNWSALPPVGFSVTTLPLPPPDPVVPPPVAPIVGNEGGEDCSSSGSGASWGWIGLLPLVALRIRRVAG